MAVSGRKTFDQHPHVFYMFFLCVSLYDFTCVYNFCNDVCRYFPISWAWIAESNDSTAYLHQNMFLKLTVRK